MHFTSYRKRHRVPSVIIVSLIDVLLVVLIFLMVTTTFKKTETIVKVVLPESKQAKPGVAEGRPFLILISSNAPYFYLGDKPVTLDRLQSELQQAVKKDPQLKVMVKADKRSYLEQAIKLLDIAKLANVGSINFDVEKPSSP